MSLLGFPQTHALMYKEAITSVALVLVVAQVPIQKCQIDS